MEHRWSERSPVLIAVTVFSRGTRLFSTTTRNLSRQGALLRGSPNQLGSARSVELQFDCGGTRKPRKIRLPAYVIHRQGGIGLMFTEHSAKVLRNIEQLLRTPTAEAVGMRHS